MTEREAKIIEVAVQLFSQYGIKRTSMNDIAKEAGVARQTLYNSFSDKDVLILGCIRALMMEKLSAIKSGALGCKNAGDVLDIILETLSLKPYRILAQSRHADEIMDSYSRFPVAEKTENDRQLTAAIEEVLQPYKRSKKGDRLSLSEIAEFVLNSAYSAKHSARDEAHLVALMNTLKLLVLKTL